MATRPQSSFLTLSWGRFFCEMRFHDTRFCTVESYSIHLRSKQHLNESLNYNWEERITCEDRILLDWNVSVETSLFLHYFLHVMLTSLFIGTVTMAFFKFEWNKNIQLVDILSHGMTNGTENSRNFQISGKKDNRGRFPFDEIFENFGWESNGTGSFPEKIFENLGQPFQCSRKVEISVFSKILVFHSKVSSRTV